MDSGVSWARGRGVRDKDRDSREDLFGLGESESSSGLRLLERLRFGESESSSRLLLLERLLFLGDSESSRLLLLDLDGDGLLEVFIPPFSCSISLSSFLLSIRSGSCIIPPRINPLPRPLDNNIALGADGAPGTITGGGGT